MYQSLLLLSEDRCVTYMLESTCCTRGRSDQLPRLNVIEYLSMHPFFLLTSPSHPTSPSFLLLLLLQLLNRAKIPLLLPLIQPSVVSSIVPRHHDALHVVVLDCHGISMIEALKG